MEQAKPELLLRWEKDLQRVQRILKSEARQRTQSIEQIEEEKRLEIGTAKKLAERYKKPFLCLDANGSIDNTALKFYESLGLLLCEFKSKKQRNGMLNELLKAIGWHIA